jgi:hypothetical protein
MKSDRLPWALGWVSLGIGLTELTYPESIARVLGVPRRLGLVRAMAVRELSSGWGLLFQPQEPRWVWSRVAGDAMDLALLASTFWRPRAKRGWQVAIAAAVVGVTLVDILAAVAPWKALTRRRVTVKPATGMGPELSGPAESWRGSGLAEDVGMNRSQGDEGPSEEVRQRMMEEAARELGLPEPNERR